MTTFDTQIDIRTARLHLRPPRESDGDRLYSLFNNWEVIRWLDSPPWPYMPEHARSFIEERNRPDPDVITAAIAVDDSLIGMIDAIIKAASAIQRERGYAIGYWIGQPYWGRGYMSEAARGFITHVFNAIPDDVISAAPLPTTLPRCTFRRSLGLCARARRCRFQIRMERRCCT